MPEYAHAEPVGGTNVLSKPAKLASVNTTLAPISSNAMACCFPSNPAAPVIRALRPFKLNLLFT